LKTAQKTADIIEVRFDELDDPIEKSLKEIFLIKKKPFIYKNTDPKNIEKIIKYNVEYIDLDISIQKKIIEKIKELNPKIKIIISFHDFAKTPSTKKIKEIIKKMNSKKADIIKIATYANNFSDSLRILELAGELSKQGKKSICVCMGKNGWITRAAGHLFGNYLMYAPIRQSEKTAEGQIEIGTLRKIQNLL
jgi:3-dehydroquinate dehydratase type I